MCVTVVTSSMFFRNYNNLIPYEVKYEVIQYTFLWYKAN